MQGQFKAIIPIKKNLYIKAKEYQSIKPGDVFTSELALRDYVFGVIHDPFMGPIFRNTIPKILHKLFKIKYCHVDKMKIEEKLDIEELLKVMISNEHYALAKYILLDDLFYKIHEKDNILSFKIWDLIPLLYTQKNSLTNEYLNNHKLFFCTYNESGERKVKPECKKLLQTYNIQDIELFFDMMDYFSIMTYQLFKEDRLKTYAKIRDIKLDIILCQDNHRATNISEINELFYRDVETIESGRDRQNLLKVLNKIYRAKYYSEPHEIKKSYSPYYFSFRFEKLGDTFTPLISDNYNYEDILDDAKLLIQYYSINNVYEHAIKKNKNSTKRIAEAKNIRDILMRQDL